MAEPIRILVRASGARRQIALLDGNRLAEYYTESGAESTLVNAVYLGRVERVVPGMSAAFVNIGLPLNAFLSLDEMASFAQNDTEKALAAGSEIIVQVKKDPKDEKGAFITRDVSIPGQYLLYMPLNRYIGVSKRVSDKDEREILRATGEQLSGGAFGLVMRSAAAEARLDMLAEELTELKGKWEGIRKKATFAKAPATLYREPSALAGLVRDYATRYTLSVTCNDAINRMPVPPAGLLWEQVSETELDAMWTAARIDAQLAEALGRRVPIKSGGFAGDRRARSADHRGCKLRQLRGRPGR